MSYFRCYTVGLCYASVCTDLTDEEAIRAMNLEAPSGLDHGWRISKDPTFKGGEPNPCLCPDDPARRHILLDL